MIDPQAPDYSNHPASSARTGCHYQPSDRQARPVISIVTPFYNTGEEFHETARTILGQSLQQWEWLIVNDGSTDPEALEILNSYRETDARVRVLDHAENRGLSAARNTGIRAAQTDYCLLIDSDDLLEPTAAEKWFWFLETHPNYAFVDSYSVCFGEVCYLWSSGFGDGAANLERNRISATLLGRKNAFLAAGGFDELNRGGLEDWEFWIRSAAGGSWGATIPEFLYWIRRRASHSDRWENLREERLAEFQTEFQQKYPHLWAGGFPQIKHVADLELERMHLETPAENKLEKTKPRLLVIAPWLVMGGAERFNLDLMRQLSERGWEISVAATARSDHPNRHLFEAITADVFPLSGFLEWEDYPRYLKYFINSRQIDAVMIASSLEGYRLLPYLRYSFPGLPVFDYLHFVTPDWMDGGMPRISLEYQLYLDASAVASQSLKNWMIAEGAGEKKLHLCTINVDSEFWRPNPARREALRAKHSFKDDETLILYVARLEPQKRPQIVMQTVQRLIELGQPFRTIVIGAGSLLGWLTQFVRENNLEERFLCLGELSSSEVYDWMAAGDILFLPSRNEGISATFYEAMASGLALVGSDVGGQSELVTPECGMLLPLKSDPAEEVEAYAQALSDLIQAPKRRRTLGEAGRRRILAGFRLEQMGDCMSELIRSICGSRASSPMKVSAEDLVLKSTAHATTAMRARDLYLKTQSSYDQLQQEYKRLESDYTKLKFDPPMPSAPASTYFYFTLRQLFYPLFRRLARNKDGRTGFASMKDRIKGLLVRK